MPSTEGQQRAAALPAGAAGGAAGVSGVALAGMDPAAAAALQQQLLQQQWLAAAAARQQQQQQDEQQQHQQELVFQQQLALQQQQLAAAKAAAQGSEEGDEEGEEGEGEEGDEEEEEGEDSLGAAAEDPDDSDYSAAKEEEEERGRRGRRDASGSSDSEESDPDYQDARSAARKRRRGRTPPGARRSSRIKDRVIDVAAELEADDVVDLEEPAPRRGLRSSGPVHLPEQSAPPSAAPSVQLASGSRAGSEQPVVPKMLPSKPGAAFALPNPKDIRREHTEEEMAADLVAVKNMWETAATLDYLTLFRRQSNLSRQFAASELEHVLAYSDGRDGLLADLHIDIMRGISPKQEVPRDSWQVHLANKIKYHWRNPTSGLHCPFKPDKYFEAYQYARLPAADRVRALHFLCTIRCDREDIQHRVTEAVTREWTPNQLQFLVAAQQDAIRRGRPDEGPILDLSGAESFRKQPNGVDRDGARYYVLDFLTTSDFRMYRETLFTPQREESEEESEEEEAEEGKVDVKQEEGKAASPAEVKKEEQPPAAGSEGAGTAQPAVKAEEQAAAVKQEPAAAAAEQPAAPAPPAQPKQEPQAAAPAAAQPAAAPAAAQLAAAAAAAARPAALPAMPMALNPAAMMAAAAAARQGVPMPMAFAAPGVMNPAAAAAFMQAAAAAARAGVPFPGAAALTSLSAAGGINPAAWAANAGANPWANAWGAIAQAQAAAMAAAARQAAAAAQQQQEEKEDSWAAERRRLAAYRVPDDPEPECKWELVASSLEEFEEFANRFQAGGDPKEYIFATWLRQYVIPPIVALKEEEERRAKAAERVQRKLGVVPPGGAAPLAAAGVAPAVAAGTASGSGGSGAVAGLMAADSGRDTGGRSRRARNRVNYAFADYDETLRSAIRQTQRGEEESDDELGGKRRRRRVPSPTGDPVEAARGGLRRGRSAVGIKEDMVGVGQFVDERQLRAAAAYGRGSRASSRAASRAQSGVDLQGMHEEAEEEGQGADLQPQQMEGMDFAIEVPQELGDEGQQGQQAVAADAGAHVNGGLQEPLGDAAAFVSAAAAPAPAGPGRGRGGGRKVRKADVEYIDDDEESEEDAGADEMSEDEEYVPGRRR